MNTVNELRVDYISDLHLDFWMTEKNPQSPRFEKQLDIFIEMIQPKKGKILILAGDQGHYFQQDAALLLKLLKYYDRILITPGNHDRYLITSSLQKKYFYDSENRILEMKQFCREHDGLFYMDGDVISIQGFRIGGIGMWHDWSYGKTLGHSTKDIENIWENNMNDANLIFQNGKKNYNTFGMYGSTSKVISFKPYDLYKKYREKLDSMENCHLIFSHYGPHIHSEMPTRYKEDIMTTFYYFDGDKDIKRLKPKYWIHGHTHMKNFSEIINSDESTTEIITNALGYPGENTYSTIQSIYLK